MFKVSVIIPIYNVSSFLKKAVESALAQPEVDEVILIEDGSKDDSLKVCRNLKAEYNNIVLLRHPEGENKGVGHSRNLGIVKAKNEYIAFLDADDWYLPDRFVEDKILFKNTSIMATFSLSTIQYPDGSNELFGCQEDFLNTLQSENVKEVYCHILKGDIILGHTNANTFRRQVFDDVGMFDPRLPLHQDSELWFRVARKYLFFPSQLRKPVSVARRHKSNRIIHRNTKSLLKMLFVWIDNIGINNLYDCEYRSLIYFFARSQTNSIRINFFRKILYKIWRISLLPIRKVFAQLFYKIMAKKF
ncbi:glycosyltransferase family 2 protein [uncultured Cyclobacterium sp.]|uniref:glycosyltransferase family 2 protein n=1 Tax=uncultured Cyclobacterium sp. TaxID=453820 RepID=UPI0030EEAF20